MPIETHHELTIPHSMAIEPKMCWTLYSPMIYIRHKLWEKNWPKMYNFAFFPIFVQKWAFPLYLGDYRLVWFRLIPIFMPAMYSPGKVGAHDAHNTLHRNFPPRHSCHSSRGRHESRSRARRWCAALTGGIHLAESAPRHEFHNLFISDDFCFVDLMQSIFKTLFDCLARLL